MPAGRILDRLYFQRMRVIATLSYKWTCANCVSSFGCVGIQASLTANTNRSDLCFDGDEFDKFHEAIE